MNLPFLAIIVFSLGGFLIAYYIWNKKTEKKLLVCPIGHSCDPVVHSDYSKFFGIRLEILGLLYYLSTILLYLLVSLVPTMYTLELRIVTLGLSTLAFLFSLYLIYVQAFLLKEWCTWCLFSAALCAAIFGTAYFFV